MGPRSRWCAGPGRWPHGAGAERMPARFALDLISEAEPAPSKGNSRQFYEGLPYQETKTPPTQIYRDLKGPLPRHIPKPPPGFVGTFTAPTTKVLGIPNHPHPQRKALKGRL